MGPEARWRRYAADLLHIIASGKQIDMERTPRYGEILAEIYHDPFEKKVKAPETAAEITSYIVGRLEEILHGSAQAGGKN